MHKRKTSAYIPLNKLHSILNRKISAYSTFAGYSIEDKTANLKDGYSIEDKTANLKESRVTDPFYPNSQNIFFHFRFYIKGRRNVTQSVG